MDKTARQFAIKEIIAARPVASQDELRRELRRQGITVTQATLSRDLKDLGVVRIPGSGAGRYALSATGGVQTLRPIVGAEVTGIRSNESMVLVSTLPGCASIVGEFIDVLRHPEILGTIAGDNTLLVVPSSHKRTAEVVAFLKNTLIRGTE